MKKTSGTVLVIAASGILAVAFMLGLKFCCQWYFQPWRNKDFSESIRFATRLRDYRWEADHSDGDKQKAARRAGVELLLSERRENWFVERALQERLIHFETLQEVDESLAAKVKADQTRALRGALEDMRQNNKTVLSNDQASWLMIAAKAVKAGIVSWEDIGFHPEEVRLLALHLQT